MSNDGKTVEPLEEVEVGLQDQSADPEEQAAADSEARKRLFVVFGGALLMVLGGFASIYFTGVLDPLLREVTIGDQELDMSVAAFSEPKPAFHELPEIIVNLDTRGRNRKFLKVRVTLELANQKDLRVIESVMPRIVDKFQVYLRELRSDDLQGARGIQRLRLELLTRVSEEVRPVVVTDVLFKQIMVQ